MRGEWQTDGDIFIGSNIASPGTTYLSVFATAQTYNSESMSAGDMLIGDNSANKANILWDYSAGQLLIRGGTTELISDWTALGESYGSWAHLMMSGPGWRNHCLPSPPTVTRGLTRPCP